MKKEQRPAPPHSKSFAAALAEMAHFLRTKTKLKERQTTVLSSSSTKPSFNIAIVKIAKLLRSQVHKAHPLSQRTWKAKN